MTSTPAVSETTPFSFCHHCGTAYPAGASFPKTCSSCSKTHYLNPTIVMVPLIPCIDPDTKEIGLLGAVRAIPPVDGICFPGGHGELKETGEMGASREGFEETGTQVDPAAFKYLMSAYNDRGILLLFYHAEIAPIEFPTLVPNRETKALLTIHEDTDIIFPLHAKARDLWMKQIKPSYDATTALDHALKLNEAAELARSTMKTKM